MTSFSLETELNCLTSSPGLVSTTNGAMPACIPAPQALCPSANDIKRRIPHGVRRLQLGNLHVMRYNHAMSSSASAKNSSEKHHTALYRKYRPAEFDEVMGQAHVVDALKAAISAGRIGHAYLFAGGRGTGKTSIARIFARAIGVAPADIYEMDAASNRTVEDARALREAVHTLPFESERKVYIVDEAHMLTKDAFNTLLKTLEEPPAHAVFILATTELDKVPDTIVSRCQTFLFKKPDATTLKGVLTSVAKAEGYTLPANAAELIALMGDGSFRDALGVLQKVLGAMGEGASIIPIGSLGEKIAEEKRKTIDLVLVERITGAPALALVLHYVNALIGNGVAHAGASSELSLEQSSSSASGPVGGAGTDGAKGLAALSTAASQGMDMRVFAHRALMLARHTLLLAFALRIKDAAHAAHLEQTINAEYGAPAAASIKALATAAATSPASSAIVSKKVIQLIDAISVIPRSPVASLPLELILLP